MQFNTLVAKVLTENTETSAWDGKPAFDGHREVYVCNIYLEVYWKSKKLEDIQFFPIHRLSQDNLQYWDKETGEQFDMFIRKYDKFEQSLQGLFTEYLLASNVEHGGEYQPGDRYYLEQTAVQYIEKILRAMFEPHKGFSCEWGYDAFTEHDILEYGFELDPGYVRKTQILGDLQDVDTTGLEDLL